MNIRYPIYEGVYRILTFKSGNRRVVASCTFIIIVVWGY